jgi:hypothetical protein
LETCRHSGFGGLRQDLADRPAEVDLEALAAGHLEAARVEAEQVQDGGVQVGDVVARLQGVVAQLGRRYSDPFPFRTA